MTPYFTSLNVAAPPYTGGKPWVLENLNEATILFGKNGSGKSLLLRTLRASDKNTFHYASPEREGEISYDPGIAQEELNVDRRGRLRQANRATRYRQEAISRIPALLQKIGNIHGRGQKSLVNLKDIERLLSTLLPDFQFKITGADPPFELIRTQSNEKITSVNSLSSGETEILTLALDLLTICAIWNLDKQEKKVLLIDEPDLHLHPDLQQHLGNFLIQLLDKYSVQIIVASHSTTFLSALGYYGGERTSVIYLNNSVPKQNAIKFNDTLQELSACLGGHALMGPLFGAPLLLVEGDDDYKVWSHVPRYHKVKLAVIPCGGGDKVRRYQKTLEKIFACLLNDCTSPVGYALLDGDKTLPQENEHNPQKNIKFINLACHESENLYLSDEVLQELGTNWEAAKQKIKSLSDRFGQKQTKLEQCDSWDRRTCDVKDVVLQLVEILDSKRVPWQLRVAKTIGSEKPTGQVARFLGENVLTALWR